MMKVRYSFFFADDVHGMWHGPYDVSWGPAVYASNGDGNWDGHGHGHGNGHQATDDAISQFVSWFSVANSSSSSSFGTKISYASFSHASSSCA